MSRYSAWGVFVLWLLVLHLASAGISHAAPFAYVTNIDNELAVIDTATRTVVARIPIGPYVHRPFVHPDGRTVYVHSDTADINVKSLNVIDATTNTISRRVDLPPGVFTVAVHPDGQRLFTLRYGCPGELQLRDLNDLGVLMVLPVGCNPAALALTPDATRAYVMNISDFDPDHACFFDPLTCELDVSVLDLINEQALAPIRNVGSRLTSIAADPRGRTIYVGALTRVPGVGVRWALLEIDTETSAVSRYTPLAAGGPGAISIAPEGAPLYLLRGANLQIFDPFTYTSVWSWNFFQGVIGTMAMTPDGAALYLPSVGEDPRIDGVLVFDTASRSIVDRIRVGRSPVQIVIGPDVPITPPPTPLGSATPTPSPTSLPMSGCTADCNADGAVSVNELVTAVTIALNRQPTGACLAADCHHSECAGQGPDVGVDCIVRAVGAALRGCPDQRCADQTECDDLNLCTRDTCSSGLCVSTCVCD